MQREATEAKKVANAKKKAAQANVAAGKVTSFSQQGSYIRAADTAFIQYEQSS